MDEFTDEDSALAEKMIPIVELVFEVLNREKLNDRELQVMSFAICSYQAFRDDIKSKQFSLREWIKSSAKACNRTYKIHVTESKQDNDCIVG